MFANVFPFSNLFKNDILTLKVCPQAGTEARFHYFSSPCCGQMAASETRSTMNHLHPSHLLHPCPDSPEGVDEK